GVDVGQGLAVGPEAGVQDRLARCGGGVGAEDERGGQAGGRQPLQGGPAGGRWGRTHGSAPRGGGTLPAGALSGRFGRGPGWWWRGRPTWPAVRSLPGWGVLSLNSVTLLRSPSRMRVPSSSPRIVGPWTVTSMKFHSPVGRR